MPITPTNPFKGRQYPGELIRLWVRWYLRYPLAYQQAADESVVRLCVNVRKMVPGMNA